MLSILTRPMFMLFRYMLSFHSRLAITNNVLDYYDASVNNIGMSPSELKREAEYEDRLVAQMKKYHIFEGLNPDKLTTIINKDVAPAHIEKSLLYSESTGHLQAKQYMKDRLAHKHGENKPTVLFTSTMKKVNAPTFVNLFDVEPTSSEQTEVINASRNVLQRFCIAYKADRHVDLPNAAKHEMVSVPISMFHTDNTMRDGNKADLVKYILESANVHPCQSIPFIDPTLSHHVIDGMAYVYRVRTQGLKTFEDFVNEYCKGIFKLPSINIDVAMDRYEGPSIKDGTRKIRASKHTKGKKKYKNKAVQKVISSEVPLPQGDDLKSFLCISENKIGLQQLLGKALI